jgi:uridylate kinase
MSKKIVLLKLTGEILKANNKIIDPAGVISCAQQIKQLLNTHYIGVVIGGGNFFRGSQQGTALGIKPSVGHQIGMLATMMNGLIIKDIFEREGIASSLFCAVPAPEIGAPVSDQAISAALGKGHCIIFSGGTGNPFFSTDTTAIVRALQINASEVWKATDVDGIYDADPKKKPNASPLKKISFSAMLDDRLTIMDAPAIALAQKHSLPIRVFNLFAQNALIRAAEDTNFGSSIY